MLYIPYPFKHCVICGRGFAPTPQFFLRRKGAKDGLRGECRECHNEKTVDWHKTHRSQSNERTYRWRAKHREQMLASRHRHYKEHQEELRRKRREYYQIHEAEERAKRREYHKIHRDKELAYTRKWQQANLDKDRIKSQRRRTNKQGLPCDFTTADWDECLAYWQGRCCICGRPKGLWHTIAQEHWIPLHPDYDCAFNPGTVPTNIVPMCHGIDGCNNSKCNHEPVKWLTNKLGPRKAQQILKRIAEYFEWAEVYLHHG